MESKDFDSILVNLVKNNSNLYDKSHKHFKTKAIREGTWSAISRVMHKSKAECCQRWKVLRNRYATDKKKERTEGKPSGWPLYDMMTFLDKFVLPRPARNWNLSPQITPEKFCETKMDERLIIIDEIEESMDEQQKENSVISIDKDINISPKKELLVPVHPKKIVLETPVRTIKQMNACENSTEDAEYAFGKTVALMLKNIQGNKNRRKVQMEIMQVLYNYDSDSNPN